MESKQQRNSPNLIIAQFKLNFLLKVWPVFAILVTLINYIVSVVKNQANSFPDSSILEISFNFPQCVFQRLAYLPLILFFFLILDSYQQIVKFCTKNIIQTIISSLAKCFWIIALIGLSLSVAQIEQKSAWDPYYKYAISIYFIFQTISILLYTQCMFFAFLKQPKMISLFSIICKCLVCAILIFISCWYFFEQKYEMIKQFDESVLGIKKFRNVLEIVEIITFNLFYISQGFDLDKITFIVNLNTRQSTNKPQVQFEPLQQNQYQVLKPQQVAYYKQNNSLGQYVEQPKENNQFITYRPIQQQELMNFDSNNGMIQRKQQYIQ